MKIRASNKAFTLIELLVVIAIIAVLVAILLPAVQQAREAARKSTCKNNLKQLGIALHNYHDTHSVFPFRQGGPANSSFSSNHPRWSGLVFILPFMEQSKLYEDFMGRVGNPSGGAKNAQVNNANSWTGYTGIAPPLITVPTYVCPSNPKSKGGSTNNDATGNTNYNFSSGDSWQNTAEGSIVPTVGGPSNSAPGFRGLFTYAICYKIGDALDGTSNTIAMLEIARPVGTTLFGDAVTGTSSPWINNPLDCKNTFDYSQNAYVSPAVGFQALTDASRGQRWADGDPIYASVSTILPPNSPNCVRGTGNGGEGVYSSSSYHFGGSQVVMADGAVRFISDNIDTGNLSAAPPTENGVASPYGVWGAMGSRAGFENVSF